MKRTLALMLLLLPLCLGAQEKAVYRITYDCDALRDNNAQRKTYRWQLDIGEATAVFYNSANRQYLQEADAFKHSDDVMAGIAGLQQLWAKYPNRNSLQVLIGKPKAGRYTYMNRIGADDLKYEEPLPQLDWTLTDSVKTICGYTCHQAKAGLYGRTWTVWYCPELPLSYGPYVLGGLPGLILEAEDADGLFHFTAVGIEQAPENTEVELGPSIHKPVKCTRKKYLALRKARAEQTYSDLANDALAGSGAKIVKITDASGKEITDQKQTKKNYLDLE